MTWYFRPHDSGEPPITTVEAYHQIRGEFQRLWDEAKEARAQGRSVAAQRELREEATRLLARMRQRLGYVLLARCPFCDRAIFQQCRLFSLEDEAWYGTYDTGHDVHPDSLCPHLFCVDGALNLKGHIPSEVRRTLTMAAGVPFVKPRVLTLPTMVAVMHSLPVAERYTAYPMVYFAEHLPPQEAFCIPWARVEYFAWHASGFGTVSGKRSDQQAYDLKPWVEAGMLYWLDPLRPEGLLLEGSTSDFPYDEVRGLRHPYLIRKGTVHRRPNPQQGEATYYHDYSL